MKIKKLKTISFDEEVVPKYAAEKIVAEEPKIITKSEEGSRKKRTKEKNEHFHKKENKLGSEVTIGKKKRKLANEQTDISSNIPTKKTKEGSESLEESEEKDPSVKKEKTKKKKQTESLTKEEPNSSEVENGEEEGKSKKEESIRARKRRRHAQLVEEKRLKAELAMQQKSLNYLSKWKHSRDEWKFEKLRQIWLQHNMYDTAKVPEEFWDVLVQYFSNSRGKARDTILKEALKLIEDCTEDDSESEMKIKRARDIIQNLQE